MKKFAVAVVLAVASCVVAAQPTGAPPPGEPRELVIRDTKIGEGRVAESGKAVAVHYTGWLYDPAAPEMKGKRIESSIDQRVPFGFIIGVGKVMKGWDQGVVGMKEGGKRTLIIPASLAYGERGAGEAIPPNSALLFELELLKILN